MIELYKALDSDVGVRLEVSLILEQHHFNELITLIDETEMSAARLSIIESLKRDHPERANQFIDEWMAWRTKQGMDR